MVASDRREGNTRGGGSGEGASILASPPRLTLRLEEVAASLGVSKRTLERERSAGRFPAPDLQIGRVPLWTVATIRRWVDGGGTR